MRFSNFTPDQLAPLHHAFVESFSTKDHKVRLSIDDFKIRIEQKLNLDPGLSFLVYDRGMLCAFLLQTVNQYSGKLTVYNGGIGVIPGERKKGLGENLMAMGLEEIKKRGISRSILEVVEDNHPALKMYEKFGFRYRRTLRCFKMKTVQHSMKLPAGISISNQVLDLRQFRDFADYEPAFIDSYEQLQHNQENETTIVAINSESEVVGYITFQPRIGRISHLAVDRSWRNRGIGRALLFQAQQKIRSGYMTIMNIPEGENSTINALERLGFENQINQFEMELLLQG